MAELYEDAGLYSQDRDVKGDSKTWENWQSRLSETTCMDCRRGHGTIRPLHFFLFRKIMKHNYCQCMYVPMRTKEVGKATERGVEGADMYLMYTGKLPDYYVSKEYALEMGWRSKKRNLGIVLPGKMIGGDIYRNIEGKLPDSPGRIWREADIDYESGGRNKNRIVYSNDGLLFVSYDHCFTFYEVIK